MSIYTLMSREAVPPDTDGPLAGPAGAPPDGNEIAATLASRIPSEAIAVYTTVLAFLVSSEINTAQQDFTGRWILAGVVAALAVLYAAGTYRQKLISEQLDFHWPVRKTLIVLISVAAWIFVIPASPFGEFSWYTPARGAIGAIVVNAFLGGLALFFEDD